MDDKRRELLIRYASTISWVWGIINIFSFVMTLVIALSLNSFKQSLPYLISIFLFVIFYCVIGFGLRKFAKWAGYCSLFISGLNLLLGLLLIWQNLQALFPLVVGGVMFTFTILGFKALK